ncbi:hypothetical protein M2271_008117 [Streptomyces sp. LBL]|nr:hypothetical protein [Streptomyces sp. LBL]
MIQSIPFIPCVPCVPCIPCIRFPAAGQAMGTAARVLTQV